MRQGRELARSTKQFASEQRGRSWIHLGTTVAAAAALIAVICADVSWMLRLAASVILALVHVRLFVIYHDFQHGAILQNSAVARCFLSLYGLLTLSPPSAWKHSHDDHHLNNSRHSGSESVGAFPVMTVDEFRTAPFAKRTYYRVARHPITIAFGYLTIFLLGFCIVPVVENWRKHLDAIAAIVLQLGLVVSLAVWRPDLLWFGLLVPSLIGSAFGSYLFYAQHAFPGVKLRFDDDWDHVQAALHSSSFLRMGPVMNWFTANIGYHHVHHLNSRIPFYRLPEVMAANEDLQSPMTTTLRLRDVARCLRLNLWDPDADRFVSYAEARRRSARRVPVAV